MTIEPRPIVLGDALGGNVVYALPLDPASQHASQHGGGVLLIDAGPDVEGSWEQAVAQARGHGFAPAGVRVVLITHAHLDHAGLARRWAEAGARILVGAADLPAHRAAGPYGEATREARREELRRHGCPEALAERHTAPRGGRPRMRWEAAPPDALEAVEDGATFALEGGDTLTVIAAPGHTPGNLVAFVEASGDLYVGDTLLAETIPTPGLHFADDPQRTRVPTLPAYLESVRRLSELPVRRLLPGHGAPIDDPQRLLGRFLAHHERRGRRIRALLAERPDSAYGLVRRLFPHLPEERVGQAMTEAIGHFDVLLAAGNASIEEDERGMTVLQLAASA